MMSEKTKNVGFSTSIKYLVRQLGLRQLSSMILAIIAMVGVGYFTSLPALYVGDIVDVVIKNPSANFALISPLLTLIAGCLLAKEVLTVIRKYVVERVATNLERDEFVQLVSKLLSQHMASVQKEKIGGLNVRIHRSIEGIVSLMKQLFLEFFPTIITAMIAMYFAFIGHWVIGSVMVGVLILGTVITIIQVSSQDGIRRNLLAVKENVGAKLTELLGAFDYVRAVGMQGREIKVMRDIAENFRKTEFTHHKWMMSFDAFKNFLESLGFVLVIGVGAWLASKGKITPGEVLMFGVLYRSVSAPLQSLHRIIDHGHEATIKVGQLIDLINRPADPGLVGRLQPRESQTLIKAKNLCMTYFSPDKGKEKHALQDISLEILQGQRIGIAGPSGSGKSTFIRTILGLNYAYEGDFEIAGVSVKEMDKAALAKMISYVPQSPFVMAGTLRDNVLYGAHEENISDDCIWRALEKAQLSDRAKELNGGLDYIMQEGGRDFSGGERQRLMLARLFVKNSKIAILDEATSALDNENDFLIQKELSRLSKDMSVLTIAHRLSTLKWTDHILVFDKGHIVQQGSYAMLAEQEGMFKYLIDKQDVGS